MTIEESDDEKSIVTPDLRLRFRWVGDQWTHSIDLGPEPWNTVADALARTREDLDDVARPVFQELHFQEDGDSMLALAIGQSGAHHFSASFRVNFRAYGVAHCDIPSILQDRSRSEVVIDTADRCRANGKCEAHYLVRQPPINLFLGVETQDWKSLILWEASSPNNYDVSFGAFGDPPLSRLSIVRRTAKGDWHVRAAPLQYDESGTQRFAYRWGHERVNAFERPAGLDAEPAWSLKGCPAPSNFDVDV